MTIGVDIGGSHITAARIDEQTIEVIPGSAVRRHVHSKGTADEILHDWSEAILEIAGQGEVADLKIGMAMPGPFDYEQGISLIEGVDKFEALYGRNIREALGVLLRVDAACVRFRNDAEAFLLGEMTSGAGRGYNRAIGITLGTGLGSAIHTSEATRDAARYSAPLFDGFAEEYISTRWLVKRYAALAGNIVKDAREIATLAAQDTVAAATFHEFGHNLGLFLKDFIAEQQPEVVVIGGNIANAWDLFYTSLEQTLKPDWPQVVIKKASLGEAAALIGGACCWLR